MYERLAPCLPRMHRVTVLQPQRQRMNVRSILRIGLLLIVAWIVLKIVFNVVGFLFHLLLIVGIIFVIYYVVTNVLGKGRPRGV